MQPRRGGEEGFNNVKKQPLSNIRGGKLAFGICCPSSQNKTQILGGHRGWEDRIRPAPLDSSGGHRVRAWGVGMGFGLRGLLILLSLPERSLSGLAVK